MILSPVLVYSTTTTMSLTTVASEPVGGMQWAKTSKALRSIHLCVIDYHYILSCLHCREPFLLLTKASAIDHAASHRPEGTRKPTKMEISSILNKHLVYQGTVSATPYQHDIQSLFMCFVDV